MALLHVENLNVSGDSRVSLCGKKFHYLSSSLFSSSFVRRFDPEYQCSDCISCETKIVSDIRNQHKQ